MAGTVTRKLDTGDYALQGLEHVCAVDRKNSASELAGNAFDKRFERELERMRAIEYPAVVCEFPWLHVSEWPDHSDLPWAARRRLRVRGSQLVKRITELQLEFPNVHWHFAGTPEAAREYTRSLLKRVAERHGQV